MLTLRRLRLSLASLTSLALAAHGMVGCHIYAGESCTVHACQTITVTSKSPQAGSSLVVQGVSHPLLAWSAAVTPEGSCSVELRSGSIGDEDLTAPEGATPPAFTQTVVLTCTLGGKSLLWATEIGDVRDRPTGVATLPTSGFLTGQQGLTGDAAFCLLSGTLTLTVEQSAGGSASFPTVVTPDYRKTLRVAIGDVTAKPTASGNGTPQPENAPLCNTLTDFAAELVFTNSAGDILGERGGACTVCAG